MSRYSYCAFLLLTGGMFLVISPSHARAQAPEAVKIVTSDGVKLNAIFFPSAKKNSPTVIMLHPVGEGKSIKLDGWKELAETLNKSDFSVLMFDFRGHGESTEISQPDEFWKYQTNKVNVKRNKEDTIDFKDYGKNLNTYGPVLINDIAAAKAFLDRRHDTGGCNTANTIVIGAENGATLGSIWINSEWNRYKTTMKKVINPFTGLPAVNAFGQPVEQPVFDKRAEGNDIIGAVWLTISPKIGTRSVSVGNVLTNACKVHYMPTVFLFGEKDADAKKYSATLVSSLKKKDSAKHAGIVQAELPNTDLKGVKLLVKGLKADEFIADYLLKNVVAERTNEWEGREFATSSYMWKDLGRDHNTGQPVPAKLKADKTFKFDNYNRFIQ